MKKTILTLLFAAVLAAPAPVVLADPVSDRITVTVSGDGPDVILIPGLACSKAVWDGTVAHLGGHYRLHLVQVAGFGGLPAGANAQGPVLQPVVDAIDAYIKANKLNSPAVIGHSIGGLMGMLLALQHPDDVGKLMIVDSLPFFGALMGANTVADATPGAAAMRDKLLSESQDAYAQGEKQFISSMVTSPADVRTVTGWAAASDKSVVARAAFEDMTTDLRAKLPEIKPPVTMLYPWNSLAGLPQSAFDRMYKSSYASLPNKTMVRIDDSRHFIMLDQPAAFYTQVDAFLK